MIRLLLILLAISTGAAAAELSATAAWARASATGAQVGGVFLTLTNAGPTPGQVVSATCAMAAHVELHTHQTRADGSIGMMAVPAITVPAQGHLDLKPGSFHIMLIGLTSRLVEGTTFPLTLSTAAGDAMTVDVTVGPAAGMTAPAAAATTAAPCCAH